MKDKRKSVKNVIRSVFKVGVASDNDVIDIDELYQIIEKTKHKQSGNAKV